MTSLSNHPSTSLTPPSSPRHQLGHQGGLSPPCSKPDQGRSNKEELCKFEVKNQEKEALEVVSRRTDISEITRKQSKTSKHGHENQKSTKEAKDSKLKPKKVKPQSNPVKHVAYKLELPEELRNVHSTFHVSNLKKCLSDESLVIPMKELRLDDKLNFVEEPVEIIDREVKQLKRSRIPIVKVRWNSKRGLEFTWEREDQIHAKYPQLFSNITPTSN
ncbi:hypothetical protein Tco_1082138 [Tanacetum coccineum]|uniref:Tf2-1-like SH3-like domain-containing protein n=1 Tax=Tanacetum coccineum TaxID=301880 RepID=A0ABQ5I1L4_9ASTR